MGICYTTSLTLWQYAPFTFRNLTTVLIPQFSSSLRCWDLITYENTKTPDVLIVGDKTEWGSDDKNQIITELHHYMWIKVKAAIWKGFLTDHVSQIKIKKRFLLQDQWNVKPPERPSEYSCFFFFFLGVSLLITRSCPRGYTHWKHSRGFVCQTCQIPNLRHFPSQHYRP